ncbi:TorD/DmsD family molecular chaperone [Ferrimonas lipolytica]|uniref:Molecular chaperone n=1 Tax=Ferrimonas lipolytica TaxID=2724191 RepID=A0A6H1UB55_9GAMM|nr:molecular chaperone [Ferrimonas lipolytica]QIZ76295.1 molecular chaperone [Ferrimonas lipolytica]
MNNSQFINYASAISGILHNLYFIKPTPEFLANFREPVFLNSWPTMGSVERHNLAIELIKRSLLTMSDKEIERDYYSLFIGPGAMKAYPWGSVYTDKENLLFGATCVAYTRFLRSWQIEINLDKNQPYDHIGLMLGVISELLNNNQLTALDKLLSVHLLPWSNRLLECIDIHANSGFYRGMAMLTSELLNALARRRKLTPSRVEIYK